MGRVNRAQKMAKTHREFRRQLRQGQRRKRCESVEE